ncbi:MAG: ATP-binding cassette domain-containing protein [Cyanobacteriota bacterium ELA615]
MLQLDKVDFYKGSICILNDINLQIEQAQLIGLIGPPSAGKTTFLKLFNRLIEPTHGQILYYGQSLRKLPIKSVRTSLVLVPQSVSLLGMRADEAISYPLKLQNLPDSTIQERLDYWLAKFSLLEEFLDKGEWELSLGQRQIVSLVRALVMQPKVLLLDEPVSALDSAMANKVIELLLEVNQNHQTTIIMVNHQLEILKQFAQRIFSLEDGKLSDEIITEATNWSSYQLNLENIQKLLAEF